MAFMMQSAFEASFPDIYFFSFFVHYLELPLMCEMNIHTFRCLAAAASKTNNRQLIALPSDRY
jgi:hypothetical protein